MSDGSDQDPDSVWIGTAFDGKAYVVRLTVGEHSRVLSPDNVLRYAAGLLAVIAQAEHDAAVLCQLRHLGVPDRAVIRLISGLRMDRPPQQARATFPLVLTPGVNPEGKPFLTVVVDGDERVGQWEIEQAQDHVRFALASVGAADLDRAYLLMLESQIELDRETAVSVVGDVMNFRWDAERQDPEPERRGNDGEAAETA